MKTKHLLTILLVLLLGLALAACGGNGAEEEPAEEPAQDIDFLLGTWLADTASQDGVTVDAYDVFGAAFSLYFSDDGKCTMFVGPDHALVDWELTDDGVVLTGDDTYPATFQDPEKKTMVVVIKGVDVLMEKYEE